MHVRVPVRVPWGYSDATVTEANSACSSNTDPHSTLNGTLTYSSHNGTAYETPRDETYAVGQEELGCVFLVSNCRGINVCIINICTIL